MQIRVEHIQNIGRDVPQFGNERWTKRLADMYSSLHLLTCVGEYLVTTTY